MFNKLAALGKFANGKYTYGNWAPKGVRSNQAACYTGVVAYNYNFRA